MKKYLSLIMLLFSLLTISSCTKIKVIMPEYKYYVEKYDGNILFGENAFNDFYLATIEGKKAQITTKTTYLLDKDGVSDEYYQEHKDEYPKIFEIIITYDGKKYIEENLTENDTRIYKYLTYEKIRSTSPNHNWNIQDAYLLTDKEDYLYSDFMNASLSSVLLPHHQVRSTIAFTKYYYKDIYFSDNSIQSIKYYNNIHQDLNLSIYQKNRLLAYMDYLTWQRTIDVEEIIFSKEKEYFRNNILRFNTSRVLKKNSDDNLILGAIGKEVGLTYRIDLINGLVIMDYIAVSTNIWSLVAKIDINDKYFFDLLNELNLSFNYSNYIESGIYKDDNSQNMFIIREDGTYDYGYNDSQLIYCNNKYYIMNDKIIFTNFNTSGINHSFNLIYDFTNKSIYNNESVWKLVE